MLPLDGRRALITGGSRGLGRSIAACLAEPRRARRNVAETVAFLVSAAADFINGASLPLDGGLPVVP